VTDYVVDASALIFALTGKVADAVALRARLPATRRHAPHLIDAEIGNVLRRLERAGRITTEEADTAVVVAESLVNHRYPLIGALARRAWDLRQNLSFYDGLYVALADCLGVPLLTADEKLSRAPGLPCKTVLV
jgi:predicted nucleic acid-binding protein